MCYKSKVKGKNDIYIYTYRDVYKHLEHPSHSFYSKNNPSQKLQVAVSQQKAGIRR